MKASYPFLDDGLNRSGAKLPSVPVIWLRLEDPSGKLEGPCLVDTGFDGGLYASEDLALLLERALPARKDYVYTVADNEIECEVFPLRAYLAPTVGGKKLLSLGVVETLVPVRANNLSDIPILGRKVLNSLVVKLDGRRLDVL